jgi:hypothetical protein
MFCRSYANYVMDFENMHTNITRTGLINIIKNISESNNEIENNVQKEIERKS